MNSGLRDTVTAGDDGTFTVDTGGLDTGDYLLRGDSGVRLGTFELAVHRFGSVAVAESRVAPSGTCAAPVTRLDVDSNRAGYTAHLSLERDGRTVQPSRLVDAVATPSARAVDTDGDGTADAVRVRFERRAASAALDFRGFAPGEYRLSLTVPDTGVTASDRITVDDDTDTDGAAVSLAPRGDVVPVGSERTVAVRIAGADAGVTAASFDVTLPAAAVARIDSAQVVGDATAPPPVVADTHVSFEGLAVDTAGESVTVARVTLAGVSPGLTDATPSVTGTGLTCASGERYRVGTAGATLPVAATETGRLHPPADDPDDGGFGDAVAIDGSRAIVGAPDADANGTDSGVAYVFEAVDGGWTRRATLVAPDVDGGDEFGASVALSGSTAVVGAPDAEGAAGAPSTGAAYVFELEREAGSGAWRSRARFVPAAGEDGGGGFDEFGAAVALNDPGSTAVIGAPSDDDPAGSAVGSATVIGVDDATGEWRRRATLVSTRTEGRWPGLGESVALSGSGRGATALVGAPGHRPPTGAAARGTAYVFRRVADGWRSGALLASGAAADGNDFGTAVALSPSGRRALVGAPGVEDPEADAETGGAGAGAVFAFAFDTATDEWTRTARLGVTDGVATSRFGSSVALGASGAGTNGGSAPTATVGAGADSGAGAAYVFEGPRVDGEDGEDAGEWRRRGVLAAADGSDLNGFGRAVAVDGGTTLVGAPLARVSGGTAGTVYAFDAVDATLPTRPPAVGTAARPPRDHDADGVYEDVNGNGRVDYDDVVTLFRAFDAGTVRRFVPAFDLNGNGRFDFADLVRLAARRRASSG